jgi:anthranilate/para-aminobenzoate synthase component II
MSMSCFSVSICVGWSGLMGALGLGVSRAARMSVRHVAMMSVDDAPGIGIFSGSHTSVSVMRSALVEGM